MFDRLAGRSTVFVAAGGGGGNKCGDVAAVNTAGLTPIDPSCFQVGYIIYFVHDISHSLW
jgi:hypothetical protein